MFKSVCTFLLMCSVVSTAEAVGFSSGTTFSATPIEGNVVVTCDGFNGGGSASFICRDVALDPASYEYFVGPTDPRAVRITLSNTREDGSVRTKADEYNGAEGVTRNPVNLWVSTLFQKPLLMSGDNHIHYSLYDTNSSQALSEGEITVVVARNGSRHCPVTHYQSADVNDCTSQFSICQRYFEQFNNCR
ncbi:MAG: hypothetical protein ACM3MG_08550 [Bacillota bacterium]